MTATVSVPRWLLSIFLSAGATASFAQHMNVPGLPCNQASTTVEEYGCFARASATADKNLNTLYTRVRSVLVPQERDDLLEAQRAWLRYRDLTCTAEYKLYGSGTGGPVTQQACLAAITEERIAALNATYGWKPEKEAFHPKWFAGISGPRNMHLYEPMINGQSAHIQVGRVCEQPSD